MPIRLGTYLDKGKMMGRGFRAAIASMTGWLKALLIVDRPRSAVGLTWVMISRRFVILGPV